MNACAMISACGQRQQGAAPPVGPSRDNEAPASITLCAPVTESRDFHTLPDESDWMDAA